MVEKQVGFHSLMLCDGEILDHCIFEQLYKFYFPDLFKETDTTLGFEEGSWAENNRSSQAELLTCKEMAAIVLSSINLSCHKQSWCFKDSAVLRGFLSGLDLFFFIYGSFWCTVQLFIWVNLWHIWWSMTRVRAVKASTAFCSADCRQDLITKQKAKV